MISKFAMDEIESMQERGLNPTPRDIIRLNALALKVDEARGKNVRQSAELLPRIALLKPGVFFRQPAIGHELWITKALRWVDRHDYHTVLAVNCYALSRPPEELPDADDPANVGKAVAEYAATMSEFTTDQLYAAIDYVKFGSDHITGEHGARKAEDEDGGPEDLNLDWDECVAVGTLSEGAAVLWGLSLAEMKTMTREQLNAAVFRAYYFHGMKHQFEMSERNALGDFYSAKGEILERLEKEKQNGPAPAV